MDVKLRSNLIGDVAIAKQIEIIEINIFGSDRFFKARLYHHTDRTSSTMFEDQLWFLRRKNRNIIQLFDAGKRQPIHFYILNYYLYNIACEGQPYLLLEPHELSAAVINDSNNRDKTSFFIMFDSITMTNI